MQAERIPRPSTGQRARTAMAPGYQHPGATETRGAPQPHRSRQRPGARRLLPGAAIGVEAGEQLVVQRQGWISKWLISSHPHKFCLSLAPFPVAKSRIQKNEEETLPNYAAILWRAAENRRRGDLGERGKIVSSPGLLGHPGHPGAPWAYRGLGEPLRAAGLAQGSAGTCGGAKIAVIF